jgi:hypothetical protein
MTRKFMNVVWSFVWSSVTFLYGDDHEALLLDVMSAMSLRSQWDK